MWQIIWEGIHRVRVSHGQRRRMSTHTENRRTSSKVRAPSKVGMDVFTHLDINEEIRHASIIPAVQRNNENASFNYHNRTINTLETPSSSTRR